MALAERWVGDRATFLDEPEPDEVLAASERGLVVYADSEPVNAAHLAMFELVPWSDDDVLEHLLAVAPERCGELLPRGPKRVPDLCLRAPREQGWRKRKSARTAGQSARAGMGSGSTGWNQVCRNGQSTFRLKTRVCGGWASFGHRWMLPFLAFSSKQKTK